MDNCLVTLIYIGAFKRDCCKHACNEHTREKEEKQILFQNNKILQKQYIVNI